jgi:D-sedoheptulose 7-phosphate isomerase
MKMNFIEACKNYRDREIEVMNGLDYEAINEAMNVIVEAWQRGNRIYVFGNGGSAATASHMANDFNKGISEKVGKKFQLVSLVDNFSTVMAIANDISYDEVFRFQLDGILTAEDVVLGISGSGNSKNVINAIEYAKTIGAKTIGMTGYNGGRLKEMSDYQMHVPINDMQITEDIHMHFDHMMMKVLGENL